MSTENKVTGQFYRILKDSTNKIWDRISYWTHSDDVELANGTTLTTDLTNKETKISKTQTDFAQVETSPSTHAYTKGQMLIYNNQLYRVKAAIAIGNTLTIGTNIEAVSVSTLSTMLTATDGKGFYFDVKDGQYGFYPTASKTSSQFVPFGGTKITKVGTISGGTSSSLSVASYSGYKNLTVDNFLVTINSGVTTRSWSTYGHSGSHTSGSGYINLSYNASTGVLTMNQPDNYNWMVSCVAGNFDVYIVE